jgi:uncharacterized protein
MTTSAPPEPRFPMAWEANLLAALLMLLMIAAVFLLEDIDSPVLYEILQLALVLPALLWIRLRRYPLRQTLRLEPISRGTLLWSAGIGMAIYPVVGALVSLFELGLDRIGPSPEQIATPSVLEVVMYLLGGIVLAPLAEETVFRGFVLTAWLRRGILPGLVMSAFLFASIHFQSSGLLPFTVSGVVYAFLVHRTGSLLSSITAHACYNAANVLFAFIPPSTVTPDLSFVVQGAVALPIALLLLRAFSHRYPALPNPAPPERTPRSWVVLSLLPVVLIFAVNATGEIYRRIIASGA